MNFLLISMAVIVLPQTILAQRPFYAGSKPIGYPEMHSRFETNETGTDAAASLSNRYGEDGTAVVGSAASTTTERLPVDALGQKELIDRIKTWPRDKWPFWYVNYVAIEEHRRARPVQPGTNMTVAGQPMPNSNQATTGNTNQRPQQNPANNQNRQNVPTNGQNQNWQAQPSNNQGWAARPGNNEWRQNQNWQAPPTGGSGWNSQNQDRQARPGNSDWRQNQNWQRGQPN